MLSKQISQARATKGLTLREVAKATGLTHSAIYEIEHGRGSFRTALRIAKAVGITGRRLVRLAQLEARQMALAA